MKTRHAFTLVEILTVVIIISILATLVTLAAAAAMRAAKIGKIGMEMSHIALALDRYKVDFGEYPPDFFDDDELVRHVKKRWPRLDFSKNPGMTPAEFIRWSINGGYPEIEGKKVNFDSSLSPLGALSFWLGGFPDSEGRLSGFNADPENPFFNNNLVPLEKRVYDKKEYLGKRELGENKSVRLLEDNKGTFIPVIGTEISTGNFVPFVYFKGKTGGGDTAYICNITKDYAGDRKYLDFTSLNLGGELGQCVPYMEDKYKDNNNDVHVKWKNSTTFQLIHPGLDGRFGTDKERIINTGDGILPPDLDNITNFSDNKELKSILP